MFREKNFNQLRDLIYACLSILVDYKLEDSERMKLLRQKTNIIQYLLDCEQAKRDG